ncbi:DUF2190 family protein [Bremerella sp. JC817]|uniref:DUF2190 family protein n=1 Tax=Bremerella sp. JC817 TaxID=3231756 RepID=UPI003459C7E0
MVDHIAAADIAAGDVVVVGDHVRIAHRAIDSGELGALAAFGGVYKVPKATGVSSGIVAGKKVFWDDANNRITATPSTLKAIGFTVATSEDGDAYQEVIHFPETSDPA